jgi:hypothetical protein
MFGRMRLRPPLELVLIGLIGLIGAVACVRGMGGEARAPIVVAVVEVTDAAPLATGTVASGAQDGLGQGGECVFDSALGEIVPSSVSCTIYEQISHGGRVTLPCGGADGPASAVFGEHEYRGQVRGKRVVMEHAYDFEEDDGCQWRIHGTITGNPEAGELAWAYSEEILEADKSNCWATCTAHTAIRIAPVR